MTNIYIAGAARTAIGTYGGMFKNVPAVTLGAAAIKEAMNRASVAADQVDFVFMGNVLQAGLGQNTARQVQLAAGIPENKTATTLNKVCGSGLHAVWLASCIIKAGEADCIVAGGMENMSLAPYLSKNARWGARMGDVSLQDEMIKDGLWDAFNDYHMGITAENVAEKYGITRQMQDEFAAASQKKAADAINSGRFQQEIVSVEVPQKKGPALVMDKDEHPRPGTDLQALAKLKPSFKKDGTVTAGNASGLNDGAAALVIVSEAFLKANNLKPIARIVCGGTAGVDPAYMGLGPINASLAALKKASLTMEDMDLVEANEAFAAQAIQVGKELNIPEEKLNVNGGAIALGHPIGASGARILVTLLYEMAKRDSRYGLATLCIGGGMGEALIVERDELCK